VSPLYLVGFHGSRAGERALAYAIGQAARTRAELLVVVADLDPALWPTQERARRLEVAALLARVESVAAGTDVRWRLLTTSASPVRALREEAREYRADLIVVGANSRGRRGIFRHLGSRLADWAPAPVLVVR
jgi:nucleotide-binding universal stress UspA family protein